MQSINRGAEELFGYASRELTGLPFASLFAPESQRDVRDALDGASQPGRRRAQRPRRHRPRAAGRPGPAVHDAVGASSDGDKLCAVFRDMTFWKKTEGELLNAKRQAEKASSAKSDFLAKISHEIRTPLNAIIGFSEVMMEERFGPVGNERYRQYLKDIHASGGHLVSLLNDLLDLSKIEAGKLDLDFASVDLNELDAAMRRADAAAGQPRAHHHPHLAAGRRCRTVVADARSVRQIVLNLLSNSIKFTGAGGQVIVSTALQRRRRGGAARARHRRRHEREGHRSGAGAVPPARHLGALGLGRHRPRPAADQGAGGGQPRQLHDQQRGRTPARWSRWRSPARRIAAE